MALKISKGTVPTALKACVYGPEGVGKTTFAASWPGAVFLDLEGGSKHYDVARIETPAEWSRLVSTVEAAAAEPEIGTLVIDTADAAEALCIGHILGRFNKQGIEDFGYGKGYTYLGEEYARILAACDKVVASGKNVLVIAHAQIRKFEQPDELGAYDRWELKLTRKCAPLVKEWADLLLFANFKTDIVRDEQTGKAKAAGGKRRVMHASHTAAYDAKNRLGLPDAMPFEFAEIAHAVPGGEPGKVDDGGGISAGILKELDARLASSGITVDELRRAVASRPGNGYTADTPVYRYREDFVRDVLLANWEAIAETVKDMRQGGVEVIDIPFAD